mmetsp:Transcript_23515/g.45674  ORF Transcript_23515/g.45674 Transcript_23515/m.45674 type:complete len:228 (+) Transcript_23515:184-867(+)
MRNSGQAQRQFSITRTCEGHKATGRVDTSGRLGIFVNPTPLRLDLVLCFLSLLLPMLDGVNSFTEEALTEHWPLTGLYLLLLGLLQAGCRCILAHDELQQHGCVFSNVGVVDCSVRQQLLPEVGEAFFSLIFLGNVFHKNRLRPNLGQCAEPINTTRNELIHSSVHSVFDLDGHIPNHHRVNPVEIASVLYVAKRKVAEMILASSISSEKAIDRPNDEEHWDGNPKK